MKALIQKVLRASVRVEGKTLSSIEQGLLVFLGITHEDTEEEIKWLASKILSLRIFPNDQGKMDLDLKQVEGSILVVSQFTLYGECLKGTRPDFMQSAKAEEAKILYEKFVSALSRMYPRVKEGMFQASMPVELINDGPLTLMLEKEPKKRASPHKTKELLQ